MCLFPLSIHLPYRIRRLLNKNHFIENVSGSSKIAVLLVTMKLTNFTHVLNNQIYGSVHYLQTEKKINLEINT